MNREDIRNLIGGYATGSLTGEERRMLFEAALDDQELFDALQDEQVLKSLLDDQVSREEVRRAAVESLPAAKSRWFAHPWIWAAAAGAAFAAVLLVVLVPSFRQPRAMVALAPKAPPRAAFVQPKLEAPANQPQEAAPARKSYESRRRDGRVHLSSQAPTAGDKLEKTLSAPAPQLARAAPASTPLQQFEPPAPTQLAPQQPQPTDVLPPQQQAAPTLQTPNFQAKDAEQPTVRAASGQAEAASQKPGAPRVLKQAPAAYATGLAGAVAYRDGTICSIARKLENGAYVDVAPDTVFRTGESLRLTVFPLTAGPISVWQLNTAHPEAKRIFPASNTAAVNVPAREPFRVPVDITVEPGERLRVVVGSSITEIVIRTSE